MTPEQAERYSALYGRRLDVPCEYRGIAARQDACLVEEQWRAGERNARFDQVFARVWLVLYIVKSIVLLFATINHH